MNIRCIFHRILCAFRQLLCRRAIACPDPSEEAAQRALSLVRECIVLIDALEDRPAGTWPPLEHTATGRVLVEEIRPELREIAAGLGADREGGAEAESEVLALLPRIYTLIDRAEAELADG